MEQRTKGTGSIYQRKDRDGYWIAVWGVVGGERRQIRRYGGATQVDAEAALAKLRKEVRVRPAQFGDAWPLVRYLDEEYLELLEARVSASHYRSDEGRLLLLAELLGKKPMRAVARADCQRALARLRNGWQPAARKAVAQRRWEKACAAARRRGKPEPPEPKAEPRAPGTIERIKCAAAVCWREAKERGLVDEIPWRGLPLERPQELAVPFLTDAELDRLYELVDTDYRPAVVVLGETAMRRGELLDLEWRDVYLADSPPALVVRRSKSRKTRRVPLTLPAVAALRELRARAEVEPGPHDRVLASIGETWHHGARKAYAAAVRALGKGHLRLHDLRHVRASLLVRAGVPITDVAAWLGHGTTQLVLQRYGRHAPEDALARALRMTGRSHQAPSSDS